MKDFRTSRNLSQVQFAKIIGVKRTTYQSWEAGRRKPSEENRHKLHQAIKQIQDSELLQDSYKKIEEYYNKYQPAKDYPSFNWFKFICLILLIIIFVVFW